jgi:predicted transcriptional regulator
MVMKELGFSQLAITCYQELFEYGGASVEQLARKLDRSGVSFYRVLKQLHSKGFVGVVKSETQPLYFYAVPLEKALRLYALYLRHIFHELIEKQFVILADRRRYR